MRQKERERERERERNKEQREGGEETHRACHFGKVTRVIRGSREARRDTGGGLITASASDKRGEIVRLMKSNDRPRENGSNSIVARVGNDVPVTTKYGANTKSRELRCVGGVKDDRLIRDRLTRTYGKKLSTI